MFAIWICLAFFHPLIELLNPAYLLKLFHRWVLRVKGKYLDMTQYEAQILQMSPEANTSRVYCYYINIVLFTMFYSYIFPLGLLIGLAAICIHYFVEKVPPPCDFV